MLSAGEVVGGFVIKGPLGRGGMAAVYRAWDPGAGRDVALKLLDVGGGSEGLLRFKREAELAARVDGQGGVVRVHARGVHQGVPFLVLELVEGRDLEEELGAGAIEPPRLARIVEEVARALARCHALGVVHRDIKPANVLLRTADDVPLLTDFGIAREVTSDKLTQTGVMMGTPHYMAPEQALDGSRATDPRVDVYALGAILYHGLAGRPPAHVLSRFGRELPPPSLFAEVDASLEAICLRAAASEPGQRHPSAAALADDLARWRAGERLVPRRRRRRAVWVTLIMLVTALLVGAAGRTSGRRALARAERLEASVMSSFLVEPAAAGSWSGGPAVFVEEASAVAARRAFLVGEDGARADAVVERLEACARLVDAHALPADEPPRDGRARAADALVTARRSGATAAVARLGSEGTRDPLGLAVEARLRAETTDASRTYVRWCAAVKDEPLAWSIARPRVLALATRACRDAAGSPGTLGAGEALIQEASTLEPGLVDEAIEGAALVWRERLIMSAREPLSREQAVLTGLRRLHAAGGVAAGPRVREAVFAAFVELDARFAEVLYSSDSKLHLAARDRVFAWDQATFEFAPDLVPPAEYMKRLASLATVDASPGLPLSFALTCVRRGVELDSGHSWDDIGRAVLAARVRPLDPLDPSGAVRLCALMATIMLESGKPLDSSVEPQVGELDPLLQRELVAGVERVLTAPIRDVSPRYTSELHVVAGEALVRLAGAAGVSERERADALGAVFVHLQAFMASTPHVPELLWLVAWLADGAAQQLGYSADERLKVLLPIVDTLRVVRQAELDADRRANLGEGLSTALDGLFTAALAAGRRDLAFAACRESFDALPPRRTSELRLITALPNLKDAADVEAFAREFRDLARYDVSFAAAVFKLDLAAGRVDEARALLAAAREEHPTYWEWPVLEAALSAPR